MMIWDDGTLTRAPRQQRISQTIHARMRICIFLHVLLQTSRAIFCLRGNKLVCPCQASQESCAGASFATVGNLRGPAKLLTACDTSEVCDQAAGKFPRPPYDICHQFLDSMLAAAQQHVS